MHLSITAAVSGHGSAVPDAGVLADAHGTPEVYSFNPDPEEIPLPLSTGTDQMEIPVKAITGSWREWSAAAAAAAPH